MEEIEELIWTLSQMGITAEVIQDEQGKPLLKLMFEEGRPYLRIRTSHRNIVHILRFTIEVLEWAAVNWGKGGRWK